MTMYFLWFAELCPNCAAYYGNRSATYVMLKNYSRALEDARKSVQISPDFIKVCSTSLYTKMSQNMWHHFMKHIIFINYQGLLFMLNGREPSWCIEKPETYLSGFRCGESVASFQNNLAQLAQLWELPLILRSLVLAGSLEIWAQKKLIN